MMSFNDFVHKIILKNKATSNIKIQVLSTLGLNDVDIYLRGGSFHFDKGIVNIQPTKGSQWVCYMNEIYFISFSCVPPNNLSKIIIKRNGYFL